MAVNTAFTEAAAVIVTVHVPVPEHPPPLHPPNVAAPVGAAVKVTVVPWPYTSLQSAPHEMPAGDEVTVPEPVPDFVVVNVYVFSVNAAFTLAAAVIDTVQVPVPVQAPLQPENVEPADGDTVSVTLVPWVYDAEQVAPQEMPAGDDDTEPLPVPERVTESV